jgi:hypothetical protein
MTTVRFSLPAVLILGACSSATPADDHEPLFHALETGSAAEAMAAGERIATAFDDSELPRLAKALDTAPVRALQLIGELMTEGSAKLLVDRLPYLLESKDHETARMAAVAAGLRRIKEATPALLQHPEEPAVIRALGRIWAQSLDAHPLARAEEIDRLTVFAVAHRQAMGGAATLEACEAMLSVMTAAELADFLSKHAAAKFASRHLCDDAVRRAGFDAEKGLHVHEAMLSNPDLSLVGAILISSPFPLRGDFVRPFLKDERSTPEGATLKDLAARRLKGAGKE